MSPESSPDLGLMLGNIIQGINEEKNPRVCVSEKDKLKFPKGEQTVKVEQIERSLRDANSWMRHYKDFISNIESPRLKSKLQFPKLISLKTLTRNYGSECPQYLAPILVIQEQHKNNSRRNRMSMQDWEECLRKIVTVQGKKGTHSNFTKEDADYLMSKEARPEKAKLKENKRKIGGIGKLKTKWLLQEAQSKGIVLRVGGQRLHTLTLKNLKKIKVSFSVIEQRYLISPLHDTIEMRHDHGTTVLEKEPQQPELGELIEQCLKEGIRIAAAGEQIKNRKTQEKKTKEETNYRRILKQCQVCLICGDKKKILNEGKIRKHQEDAHGDSFMLEKLRQHEDALYPVVKIIHAK